MTTSPTPTNHLIPRLIAAATPDAGIQFLGSTSGNGATRITWEQLHSEARAVAARLQGKGIGPGSHVAILGPSTRSLVTCVQALWLTGATVVLLPLPMRLSSIETFVEQTRVRIRNADVSHLLIDGDLAPFAPSVDGVVPHVMHELTTGVTIQESDRWMTPALDAEAMAVLQFTSGSTSDPKGVMVLHRTLLANLDGAAKAAELTDDEIFCHWLPLYHDMGLIGLTTIPMITGRELALAAPQDFLAAPAHWMEWMSETRATVTAGPNFAWSLAARGLARSEGLDLSAIRIALSGAEPVDPTTISKFCTAAAPFGFDPSAFFPAFGMAEVMIAGTFPRPGRGLVVDEVETTLLEHDGRAVPVTGAPSESVRALARLGTPIPGMEMRIVSPETGVELQEREVGELELRGTSMTPGYYKNEAATLDRFHDGWFRTGDLGYIAHGELVLCGRLKDMIIVGGRNVFPEDIERAAADVGGVRTGNVIAFGTSARSGREGFVVVAETRGVDIDLVKEEVASTVLDAVGLPPHEVVLVEPGTLPKTSSGKLQRSLAKAQWTAGDLVRV